MISHPDQYDILHGWERYSVVSQEMKLRRMAVDAAVSRENPARFAISGGPPVALKDPGCLPPAGSYRWRTAEVSLAPGVTDHDTRVLMAEEILRPQLRTMGWRV